jgi:serine/threonine protein kinase
MPWPLSQDYNEAIQSPSQCFADPELRQGEAVTNDLGLPAPRSGNFADVYALVSGPRKWAVKCFTRQIPGLQERYQQISLHLEQVKLPFMVDFTFLDRGIRVRGDWYPILKMQWVEGLTLNQFVKSNLDKPALLDMLCQLWLKLAKRLREANIAHCDLQHGNVLLVPGGTAGKLSVKLVDYDGMCVPALTLLKSIEAGHPSYQHPRRQREGIYSLEVDRFSNLAIYTALRALMTGGKPLWDKHDDGDNLLFKHSDYAAPTRSKVFQEMLKSSSAEVSKLVRLMMKASDEPLEQAPLLELVAATVPSEAPASTAVRKPDLPWQGIQARMPNPVGPEFIPFALPNADPMDEAGDRALQVKRKRSRKLRKSSRTRLLKRLMAFGLGFVGLLAVLLGALWAGGVFQVQATDDVQVVQVNEPNELPSGQTRRSGKASGQTRRSGKASGQTRRSGKASGQTRRSGKDHPNPARPQG